MKTRKLNVGVFTHDFFPIFGGQGRHLHEIYKQNKQNKDINLLIFSPNSNQLEGHIKLYSETKRNRFKNLEFSFKLNRDINKLIEKYALDIVHIHGGPGGLFFLKEISIPVVYTSHHTYWQQSNYIKNQRWKRLFCLLEKIGYKKADKIICVSKDTLKILIEKYGITKDKLEYIPNGVEINNFSNNTFSKIGGLLFVGRIDKRKGLDFLLQAMSLVNRDEPGIKLHVVGEGKDKKRLEKFSKLNNLNVKFYGFLSDREKDELYKKISVQIIPSIFEGFGISVLEGMSKGKAVIGTNVDGIKSIIRDNENGMLVNYGDPVALAESIKKLTNNNKLRDQLVNMAYAGIKDYQWKDIYHKTIKVYENLIS